MEFRYRAGEEKERASASLDPLVDSSSSSTSSTSSYSYFTQQAILAGIDIGSLGKNRSNVSKESLLEEIRRKRLREEMLVREIARKRMLEEEILRELENGSEFKYRDAWFGSELGRSSFDNQETSSGLTEIRFTGRVDELKKAELGNAGLTNFSNPEMSTVSLDRKFPANKLPGVKRKTTIGLPVSVMKEWSCSLCHVTASSENNLNVHITGKKHKAKEARLIRNKTTSSKKLKKLSTIDKDDGKPLKEEKDIRIDEYADEARQIRNNQPSNKNDTNEWCWSCRVDCNSSPMLQIHQCGKKHKAQLEANTSESAEVVIKEVTEEKTVKKVNEGQDNVEVNEESLVKTNVEANEETSATKCQDNVEANEETMAKNNAEANEETLISKDQDNVEAEERTLVTKGHQDNVEANEEAMISKDQDYVEAN